MPEDSVPAQEPTPKDSVHAPEHLSLIQILRALTLAQAWALLVALGTVLSASFGLGVKLAPMLNPNQSAGLDLVPCFKAAGYPLGEWLLSGEVTVGRKDMLTSRLRLTSPTEGTSITNEKGGNVGQVVFDRSPQPGEKVHYRVTDGTGYEGNVNGNMSNSGCSLEGIWYDTNGHSGNEILFWIQPHEFWVKRSAGP